MKGYIRESFLEEVEFCCRMSQVLERKVWAEEAAEGKGWHFSRPRNGEMRERWSQEGRWTPVPGSSKTTLRIADLALIRG